MEDRTWHQLDAGAVCRLLATDRSRGLSGDEASRRLAEAGPNELAEADKASPVALFVGQFKDFMVLVLVAAALVSGLLGEFLDAITILAIIVMNGILGFAQEYRAEKSLRALRQLASPMARAVRDGRTLALPARELVPGDVVLLESGDRVPADVRILEAESLHIEESALTGESVPVEKHAGVVADAEAPLGDRRNMGFMGTMVTRGTGRGVVVRTGMATEMGRIAHLIQATDAGATPLQRRLEQLGKILIAIAVMLTAAVAVAGILHGQPAYDMFLAGVSLAVAAIPEGLPAIVTIALALGVQRMIRRRAIVRRLPSVETLGCASVICSDKTGTLTQNKMTVTHLWQDGGLIEVTGTGYEPRGSFLKDGRRIDPLRSESLNRLLLVAALCNNASLVAPDGEAGGSGGTAGAAAEGGRNGGMARPLAAGRRQKGAKGGTGATEGSPAWTIQGDPTEGALAVLAAKAGIRKDALPTYEREREFPFDSERKRMSVIVRHGDRRFLLCKGAPDLLLDVCSRVLWQGHELSLTGAIRSKVLAANEGMARAALRVIGFAWRELKPGEQPADALAAERQMVFVGLAGMIDPPRREVRQAISLSRKAGIRTVMITGDHQATAAAIASDLGILPKNGLTVTGRELEAMSDAELEKRVDDIYVYARVSPEHKLRIVKALQKRGHVVAMTGDGVNDAPAIKAADIGIAMGIAGTDVAKEASALVLSDDNYSTIVAAIEEGRGIYENIRKFIRYLLASNVGEILTMLLAMLMGMPMPLVPIQILWVNLVTDGLPAMALGVDQPEKELMQQQPRPAKESIFARRLGWKIISRGTLIGLSTLGAFWIVLNGQPGDAAHLVKAQTVAFATLVMAQLIHVFDCRSSRSIFHRNPLQNRYLVLAVLSSVLLLIGVIYIEPLQPIFKTVPLGAWEWLLVLSFAAFPTFFFGIGSVMSGRRRARGGTAAGAAFRRAA